MKFRNVVKKILCVGLVFCFAGTCLFGCGSSDSDADSSDEEEEEADEDDGDDEDETEIVEMTLEDGSTVDLIELEEGDGTIYGEYICESDDSVWAFGGDTLAVAYEDDDGEMRAYICSLTFYQTAEADEDGNYDLCINLTNILENTSSCWYAANLVDEDENTVGVALIDPSDEDSYISLLLIDDDDDDDDDEEDEEEEEDEDSDEEEESDEDSDEDEEE